MATPKQTDPQFKLRMTPAIKDAIEAAASTNKRSMNAEILARLEASFEDNQTTSEAPDTAQIKAMLESAAKVAAKEAAKEVADLLRGRLESLDIKVQRGIDGRIKNRDTELKRRKGE
ncbi:Arc family DNA-binding protein [Ochrobactrum sp. SFR4]|nr:Arc family DNA-binding protein [Ochrobactrum sp. SFR4]